MAKESKIPWTDATWNPVTGCTPTSPGCARCYAQRYLHRFARPKGVTLHGGRLHDPMRWKPRKVFVCSMADLFHQDVPDHYIERVYRVMSEDAPQHIYQVLSKRPERLVTMKRKLPWPKNIWHGVSVENDDYVWRIEMLKLLPSTVRFISFEPLLGPPDIASAYLDRTIHWCIAGGETGPGARAMEFDWVRTLRDECVSEKIPFFFKQWGGRTKRPALVAGRSWKQMPKERR